MTARKEFGAFSSKYPVLDKLESSRVVAFSFENGKLCVTECCDEFFCLVLDENETRQLVSFLNEVVLMIESQICANRLEGM